MKLTNKPATEDAFVRAALPLIASVATSVRRKHRRYDHDDLKGYGAIGALKAYREWKPEGGMAFDAYCYIKIRNAIYDGIRTMATMPRRPAQRAERENAALGLMAAEASTSEFSAAPSPEAEAIAREEHEDLRRAFACLRGKQAAVIGQLLLGADQVDIAKASGASKTRVSRAYTAAIENMRRMMCDPMHGIASADDRQGVLPFPIETRGAA